jgi:hypothetical protein
MQVLEFAVNGFSGYAIALKQFQVGSTEKEAGSSPKFGLVNTP